MRSTSQDCFRRPAMWIAGSLAALLLVGALAGCGDRKMPPPSDPAQGRLALQASLEAWKSGAAPEALLASQPPIRVRDEDWRAGRKLLGYELAGEGEIVGLTLRCPVVLSLEHLPGQNEQKNVSYAITTNPSIIVKRIDPES